MCVWRLRVWAWKCNATVTTQPCIIGRGRHTHRGERTDASLLWRCVSLCLWVWSLSELGYIMAKCERSPTGSSAVPISPNSSPLPILISNLFQTPQFLDSFHVVLFCILARSAVLALRVALWWFLAGMRIVSSFWEWRHPHDPYHYFKIISFFWGCFYIAVLLMSALYSFKTWIIFFNVHITF